MRRVYRSSHNAIIGGVCGGIADYFEVDPTIVRLAWAALIFLGGTGILAYLIAWLIIPTEPHDSHSRTGFTVETHRESTPTEDPFATEPRFVAEQAAGTPSVSEEPTPERPPVDAEITVNHPAAEPQLQFRMQKSSGGTTFGIILIAAGAFLLARSFLPWLGLHRFWPVILVGLGAFIIATSLGGPRR